MSASASPAAIAAFYAVRDMPYALDAAHDADGLERLGAGDCLAKADLLARLLRTANLETRLVRWRYVLPDVVPEVAELPSRLDVHRAVQVRIGAHWILIDATHDPGLAAGGLVVATWDGRHPTPSAYPAVGNVMIEGRDETDINLALVDIETWTVACDRDILQRWRTSYITWLVKVRRSATEQARR